MSKDGSKFVHHTGQNGQVRIPDFFSPSPSTSGNKDGITSVGLSAMLQEQRRITSKRLEDLEDKIFSVTQKNSDSIDRLRNEMQKNSDAISKLCKNFDAQFNVLSTFMQNVTDLQVQTATDLRERMAHLEKSFVKLGAERHALASMETVLNSVDKNIEELVQQTADPAAAQVERAEIGILTDPPSLVPFALNASQSYHVRVDPGPEMKLQMLSLNESEAEEMSEPPDATETLPTNPDSQEDGSDQLQYPPSDAASMAPPKEQPMAFDTALANPSSPMASLHAAPEILRRNNSDLDLDQLPPVSVSIPIPDSPLTPLRDSDAESLKSSVRRSARRSSKNEHSDLDVLPSISTINTPKQDKKTLKRKVNGDSISGTETSSQGGGSVSKRVKREKVEETLPKVAWPEKTQSCQFIECDVCSKWYHFGCVGVTDNDPRLDEGADFKCPPCTSNPRTRRSRAQSANKQQRCARPDCDQVNDSETYFIKRIIGRMETDPLGKKKTNGILWLVEWDNYPLSAATWEPEASLGDPQALITEFSGAENGHEHRLESSVLLLKDVSTRIKDRFLQDLPIPSL